MLHEEDFSSDSSDEDFVPQGFEAESEDESISGGVSPSDSEVPAGDKSKKRKKKTKSKRGKKKNPFLKEVESMPIEEERKEENNKEKENDLWADFLADVEDKPVEKPKAKKNSWGSLLGTSKKKEEDSTNASNDDPSKPDQSAIKKTNNSPLQIPTKLKVTKVFEFAGEEVRIEQEVSSDSPEAQAALLEQSVTNPTKEGPKRSIGVSGVASFLDSKRQKLSTLEKTKFDWMKFKSDEGIEDELQHHLKSKHGYLEKKEFLERADVRQFELEREMRMNKRSKR